jgi:hypothetical protein
MTQRLTLIYLFIVAFQQVQAQTSRLGVRLGGSASWINLKRIDDLTYQERMGGMGGIVFEYRFSPRFALQPELNLSLRGWNSKFSQFHPGPPEAFTAKSITRVGILYVELPLLVKTGRKLSENMRLDLFTGPTLSYALRGTSMVHTRYESQEPLIYHPEEDHNAYPVYFDSEFRRLDVQLLLGAGISYSNSQYIWFGDFRYMHGIFDLNHAYRRGSVPKIFSRNLIFSAGLMRRI